MIKSILHITLLVILLGLFLRHVVWLVKNWKTNDTKINILYVIIDLFCLLFITYIFLD